MATAAPSLAKRVTPARPMPEPPAVTMPILPSSRMVVPPPASVSHPRYASFDAAPHKRFAHRIPRCAGHDRRSMMRLATSRQAKGRRTMARVALVTGGTRGIGAAISRALHAQGRTVVANYAGNDAAAQAFAAETGIKVYKFDVSNFAACQDAVKHITAEIGPIEIVVNNAGITRDGTLAKMDRDMWDAVLDTNLGSCYNLCKLTFDAMRAQKFGRIVNIGSINGQAGQYGQVNYAAAKSGIHGFTKALAQEGARFGITVN